MAATVSFGRPKARRICSIFPLWMESKALVKSTNNIVASRFFESKPSRIRRIVKICEVIDLFLRKPFWFFQSILSIFGSMRLCSRALYILAVRAEVALFWEGEDASLHPYVKCIYTALQCRSSMSSNFLVFHTSGGILSSSADFLFLIFLSTESSSSWVNGPSLMSNCLS